MVTTLEGDTWAIDSNAAAPVSNEVARFSPTKRFSGRTYHTDGSQYSRYSSSAVIITCDGGAILAARRIVLCSRVEDPPSLEYCAGEGLSPNCTVGAHSGP